MKNLALTFFFTAGVGLRDWADTGSLERELELYRRLARKLKRINLVTYGGKADRLLAEKVPELNLLTTRWYPRQELTTLYLSLRYCPQILGSDILKTNQIRGSQVAVWIKKFYRKKLIVRCGYLHSLITRKRTDDEKRILEAVTLERTAFLAADVGIVSTAWQRDMVVEDYGLDPDKIRVVPNYVMTEVFKPQEGASKKYDLIFIGRAEKEKNLDGLLKALHSLKTDGKEVSLLLVGSCCDNAEIKQMIKEMRLNVSLKGNLPNFDLPKVLNQAKIFILPSHFEHHPKVLLEAMSCGLPCIGTKVTGIKEDIEHRQNGLLCETDPRSIAEAIDTLLAEGALRETLGVNARKYVRKKYDIERILEMELEIIQELGEG